jgi:Fe-S cluster assembly iron-binding protein IscA
MLEVTTGAKELLKEVLTEYCEEQDAGLRLLMNDAGELMLGIDIEKEEDQVVEHEGARLLFIDKVLSDELEGFVIDMVDTPDGTRLTMLRKDQDL